jgi:hypothetical protein
MRRLHNSIGLLLLVAATVTLPALTGAAAAALTGPRALQADSSIACTSNRAINTTYNNDAKVPARTGIMFEISASSNVKILTFELDVHLDLVNNDGDLAVEVYTLEGSFADKFDQPDAWQLIAQTDLVVAPEGFGAIVPVQDFHAVDILARGRRSFYITMNGPFLDSNVNGLQKTGDIQMRDDDIQLLVGAGLNQYKFPAELDRVVHPMFSGVIHYQKSFDCQDNKAASTSVSFQFLMGALDAGESALTKTSAAIDQVLDKLLKENDGLHNNVVQFGLQKLAGAQSTLMPYHGTYKRNSGSVLLDGLASTDKQLALYAWQRRILPRRLE